MMFYKILFHLAAAIKSVIFKSIYGGRFHIGKNVTWRKRFNVMIAKGAEVKIGNQCFLNNDCSINANNNISIGEGCLFGENVKIYDHNHRFGNPDLTIKEQGFSDGTVIIGNNCWIGSNVVILKDSWIEDNCVIGAGVIVSGHIKNNTLLKCNNNYCAEEIRFK